MSSLLIIVKIVKTNYNCLKCSYDAHLMEKEIDKLTKKIGIRVALKKAN